MNIAKAAVIATLGMTCFVVGCQENSQPRYEAYETINPNPSRYEHINESALNDLKTSSN